VLTPVDHKFNAMMNVVVVELQITELANTMLQKSAGLTSATGRRA